jgi:hypothetical protein
MRNNVARAVIVALASHLGLDRAEEEVLGGPGNMARDPGGECVHHPGQKHPERSCLVGIAYGPGPQAVCTEFALPMYRGRDRCTQNANTCARTAVSTCRYRLWDPDPAQCTYRVRKRGQQQKEDRGAYCFSVIAEAASRVRYLELTAVSLDPVAALLNCYSIAD